MGPIGRFPSVIPKARHAELSRAIEQSIQTDVFPAYRALATFVEKEYAPRGRLAIQITSLPKGASIYRRQLASNTTTNMSPEEIHAVGLSEVARITREMNTLATGSAGYRDLAAFQAAIQSDIRYKPASPEQIVADYSRYVTGMKGKLAAFFSWEPPGNLIVAAMPA